MLSSGTGVMQPFGCVVQPMQGPGLFACSQQGQTWFGALLLTKRNCPLPISILSRIASFVSKLRHPHARESLYEAPLLLTLPSTWKKIAPLSLCIYAYSSEPVIHTSLLLSGHYHGFRSGTRHWSTSGVTQHPTRQVSARSCKCQCKLSWRMADGKYQNQAFKILRPLHL